MSLPAWGAWIEISTENVKGGGAVRRSPHGERGLKCSALNATVGSAWSLPAWGAWIEMEKPLQRLPKRNSRSPHGERGLKYVLIQLIEADVRRSPHGERGLK